MQETKVLEDLLIHAEKTAENLAQKLKKYSITLALAESCTAGMAASLIVGIPGASTVLWGCFVCYTEKAKVSMLGIDGKELSVNGLVSMKTASLMAEAALKKSGAHIAAAVTGLAGPDGDGSSVPVGTVWIAIAKKGENVLTKEYHFSDSRNNVRVRAAAALLEAVLNVLPN